MNVQEFLLNWTKEDGEVSPISRDKLLNLQLQPLTMAYLEAGLPKEAAPYLSFVSDSNDVYKGIARLEDQYDLELETNKYIVIGSDGNGNPIAINVQCNDLIINRNFYRAHPQ